MRDTPGRPRPIRVLVVDDSAVFRLLLGRALDAAGGIEVVGYATDGYEALDAVGRLHPDVVTLDVEMPGMDGLATLERLLAARPTRVVMLSGITRAGAAVTIEALRIGAIDAIAKPSRPWNGRAHPFVTDLESKIRAAALVGLSSLGPPPGADSLLDLSATGAADRRRASGIGGGLQRLVIVAASTGGPRALNSLLRALPSPLGAGVIVIQHMLTGFTAALAERLDRVSPLRVRETFEGDRLVDEEVLLAPGDHHLLVDTHGSIRLVDLPAVNGVRPAADVTLLAAAPAFGERLLAVVLTGMGRDGTAGAQAVHAGGGRVLAQDEASAVVYGMPRSVVEAGVAAALLPPEGLAGAIAEWARRPVLAAAGRDPAR